MTAQDLPPLPDDIAALLDAERPLVAVNEAQRLHALGAVESKIAALGAASHVIALAKGKLAGIVAVTFAVGALTGGAGVALFGGSRAASPVTSTPPSSVTAIAPPTAASPPQASAESPAIAVSDLPSAAPSAAVAPSPHASAAAAPSEEQRARGLAAERALLDVARGALARGAPEETLEATARHAREYPQGVLAEEREALAIRALAATGRRDEASARAARFRERFPKSLSLPAVEAAVGSGKRP